MFKFEQTSPEDHAKVVYEFDVVDVTWGDVVARFQCFLSGCGYVFDPGFDMQAILEQEHDLLMQKKWGEV